MDRSEQAQLRIFDTTLRDGDLAAGFSLSSEEKIALADQLDAYGVDCIEVGFPCSSPADFDCCRRIASRGLHADIAVLSRCLRDDILHSAQVFAGARCGRRIIYLSVPVSENQICAKFGTDIDTATEKICHMIEECVRIAVPLADIVEVGFEDATRADPFFLAGCCRLAIESGAGVVNIADTVGCVMPEEMGALVCLLKDSVPDFFTGTAILSVHCHNDMGLALASALCAVRNGADQIEVTAGGIGERCGNVQLEELAYVLESRSDIYRVRTHLNPELTGDLCHLLFSSCGSDFSPFKPVTGGRRFILGRYSGRAGLEFVLAEYLGIHPDKQQLMQLLSDVKIEGGPARAVGITDLCRILYRHKLLSLPPFSCNSLTVSCAIGDADPLYTVQAELFRERPILTVSGTGSSMESALLAALSCIPGIPTDSIPFELRALSTSRCRVPASVTPSRTNVYAELSACRGKRLYSLSGNGANEACAIFSCMLDVLNAELVITGENASL